MSIDQLDLILYDMYRMDAWLPPLFGKWTEDYKKASYSQWAVDELRDFIAEQIYPRREGSIDEFCKLTHEFMMKTAKYARINPNTSLMPNEPYVISPDDYGENDNYTQISLVYYAGDEVLADDEDEVVEDIENTVGEDFAEHFGEYEDDSVFIRNDRLRCDYEILRDNRSFSDVAEGSNY